MGIYVAHRPCDSDGPYVQLLSRVAPFSGWYATEFAEDGSSAVLDLLRNLDEHGAAGLPDGMDRETGR